MKLEIKTILPKDWKFEELDEYIKIWYKNPNKSPTPLIIKKQIEISEDLGKFLGFWAGDGSKRSFGLSNNNINLLRKIYDLVINRLGNIEFRLRITIPINFINEKEEIIRGIKTKFPELCIGSIGIYKQKRNAPNVNLYNNKTMTSKFIKLFFEYLSNNINFSHSYWDGYLKGFFAAEGNIYIRKDYNTLSKVNITQNNNLYKQLAMNSLKARYIEYSNNKKGIVISGKKNFDKLFSMGICDLHDLKREQFLMGYKNYKQKQYENGVTDLLILKELKTPQRISIIAKKVSRCRQTIREHMILKPKSLKNLGLIRTYGNERGIRGAFYGDLWKLTNKGLEYLNNLKMVKDE